VADALDRLAGDSEIVGVLAERPMLAVTVDGVDPAVTARLARLTADLPCVTVGIASEPLASPPAFDVLLATGPAATRPWVACPDSDLDTTLGALAAGIERSPQAATTLVQVLRLGRGRSLEEGLTIESFAYATLQSGAEHRAWLAALRSPSPRPSTRAEPVVLEREGTSLVVTLRRPEVRNAVDAATRDGLVAAFDLGARDTTIRQLELRGAGPDFCSGGDLGEFGTTPDPALGHLVRSTRSPARALARCADRTTAHVHGACIGAGLELAALAGQVVARPDARFQLPEVAMGLIPGAGGTATIPRRIGRELTAWMALTGAAVDAPTALRWGLVDAVG